MRWYLAHGTFLKYRPCFFHTYCDCVWISSISDIEHSATVSPNWPCTLHRNIKKTSIEWESIKPWYHIISSPLMGWAAQWYRYIPYVNTYFLIKAWSKFFFRLLCNRLQINNLFYPELSFILHIQLYRRAESRSRLSSFVDVTFQATVKFQCLQMYFAIVFDHCKWDNTLDL